MHHRFSNGLLGSNGYIVWNDAAEGKPGFILDLGVRPDILRDFAVEHGITVRYLIYSHGHYDHAHYAGQYKTLFPDAVLCGHADEETVLTDPVANVSALCGDDSTYPLPEMHLADGDEIILGDGADAAHWQVLHTPGHTPGCICLYSKAEGNMLTGDTLFADGGFGRYDFKYGDVNILAVSLARLLTMEPEIRIFPGHGGMSTVGRERPTLRYFGGSL